MGHFMPTLPVLPWAPSQFLFKIAPNVPPWEEWKIPKFQTKIPSGLDLMALNCKGHNPFLPSWITMLILKGFWKPITSLLYSYLSEIGLLFLNLQSELSYEVWIKSYKHLKTEFLSGNVYVCHIMTTHCEVHSWSRSKNSPDLWHLGNIPWVQAKYPDINGK